MYNHLRNLWKKPKQHFGKEAWKNWLVELRSRPAFERIENAPKRSLGER